MDSRPGPPVGSGAEFWAIVDTWWHKIATSRPALYIKVKVKVNFIGVAHFRATLAPSDSFGTALMK